ncbi:MAG: hypothetical protein FJW61_09430, partial [Actinobacteria bacterium]|nr:hypothetical protein [Actinomycetota bacterium]
LVYYPFIREAMNQAFNKAYGIFNVYRDLSISGKTDSQMLGEALNRYEIKSTLSQIRKYKNSLFAITRKMIKSKYTKKFILPGVRKLLYVLSKRKDVRVGLLTGNWKKGAYIKLGYYGLSKYFRFGAFGDDAILRDDLVAFAIKRSNLNSGINIKDVVIIGDTPMDIRCAKNNGATSVAVATGRFKVEELYREGADLVLENLADTNQIIGWIFGNKTLL